MQQPLDGEVAPEVVGDILGFRQEIWQRKLSRDLLSCLFVCLGGGTDAPSIPASACGRRVNAFTRGAVGQMPSIPASDYGARVNTFTRGVLD